MEEVIGAKGGRSSSWTFNSPLWIAMHLFGVSHPFLLGSNDFFFRILCGFQPFRPRGN